MSGRGVAENHGDFWTNWVARHPDVRKLCRRWSFFDKKTPVTGWRTGGSTNSINKEPKCSSKWCSLKPVAAVNICSASHYVNGRASSRYCNGDWTGAGRVWSWCRSAVIWGKLYRILHRYELVLRRAAGGGNLKQNKSYSFVIKIRRQIASS